jgi:hypothetical protein
MPERGFFKNSSSANTMWSFNPERVRENARRATTEDLLDRVTAYRGGMEPEALRIIEQELQERGITAEQIEAHAAEREQHALPGADGIAQKCSFCSRPAVTSAWGWQKLWRVVPVFPKVFYYCEEHRPHLPVQ